MIAFKLMLLLTRSNFGLQKVGQGEEKAKHSSLQLKLFEVKKEDVKLSLTEYLSKSENKPESMALLGETYKPKISSACRELKFLQSSTKTV